ncbi:spermidine synthase [Lutibaculum baratangense]|uniref:Spermidine synthase n=1 Tax=Lutibaculum baratangense AMV1 TaxID=631454 RepID=V4RH45_9HYPH|nr:hypothetical protein [Lutibaculum baratangense]ESR25441.1 hypothetical protein N177_1736 [Lutibaculum baratangense AMV1]
MFEELDYRPTPLGALTLRRRRRPGSDEDVYEIMLRDEFLMSSMFTFGETELARLALSRLDGEALDVVVGGLGLGHTAQACLSDRRVDSLLVVEALEPVVEWHEQGLVPLGRELSEDARCRFVVGDFFRMVADSELDPDNPGRRFDAIVVDIDHSPELLLSDTSASFYEDTGLAAVEKLLRPGGVFALWSTDPPDDGFLVPLRKRFAAVEAHVVSFPVPNWYEPETNTVYVATVRAHAGDGKA